MQFEMWSIWHFLYIASPIVIMAVLWLILKNKSQKTKYIVGVVIGCLSLGVLLARNIDIFVRTGWDPEILPLQVCHFGNIMVFISLVFRSKIATAIAWSLNLLAAAASLIVADALTGYADIFVIRAQAYIWGHLFIVLGSLYAVIFKIVRINIKSFLIGLGVVALLLIPSIILNSYFNDVLGYSINYFYVYNSHGVPFEFIDALAARSQYGWFTINWLYTAFIIVTFGLACTLSICCKSYSIARIKRTILNIYLQEKSKGVLIKN